MRQLLMACNGGPCCHDGPVFLPPILLYTISNGIDTVHVDADVCIRCDTTARVFHNVHDDSCTACTVNTRQSM